MADTAPTTAHLDEQHGNAMTRVFHHAVQDLENPTFWLNFFSAIEAVPQIAPQAAGNPRVQAGVVIAGLARQIIASRVAAASTASSSGANGDPQ